MTVSTTGNRVSYAGNGVTTVFSFPNKFLLDTDIVVLSVADATGVATTKVLTTDYTLTGAGGPAGGNVTMLVAPATGTTLVVYRDAPLTQPIDPVNGDPLNVDTTIEAGLDRSTLALQRVRDLIDRSLHIPDGDTGVVAADLAIPAKINRANKFLAFDADGKPLAATSPTTGVLIVSSYVETLLDDVDAATARATLGLGAADSLTFTNLTLGGTLAVTGATTLAAAIMSGDLTIAKAGPNVTLNATGSFDDADLIFQDGGIFRYILFREGSSGNLRLNRFDASGVFQNAPLIVDQTTGLITVAGDPTAALGIATKQYVDATQVSTALAAAGNLSAAQGANSNQNLGSAFTVAVGDIIEVSLAGTGSFSGTAGQLYVLEWGASGVTLDAVGGLRGNMCVFGNGAVPAMPATRARVLVGGSCQLGVTLRNVATTAGTITVNSPTYNVRVFKRG